MGEWVRKKISEVGQVISGATPSTSRSDFWSGDIIWITPTDLSKNKTPFIQDSERKISEAGLLNCSAFVVPSGNLVLSSRAPIGYFAIVNANFTTNQGCKSVIFNKGQYPLFHYYNFLFRVKDFKEKGEGTTFAEISKSVIAKLEFPAPDSFHEQTTIASILITIDQSIEKTEQLISKYERIKTGLMQDLLTRGIDEQVNIRSEEIHEFKDSALGRIPKEWEEKSFELVSDRIIVGIATSSSSSFTSAENGVLFLRNQNIKANKIDLFDTVYITNSFANANKSKFIKTGDVLTVRTGYPGISAVVPIELEGAQTFTTLITRLNTTLVLPEFASLWLNSELGKAQIKNLQGGGAQQNLNAGALKKILILMPSIIEQEKIVQKLNGCQDIIVKFGEELQKLQKMKTALMQDLLTGKVRVDNLLDAKTIKSVC